ncbi:hypothetical protein [Synechococcus sp. M16CYN]|uniref:hypothetical protein n=1 Tax=Synechococcus sp. M16CYN TaxID=3103139 RepID=UPI00334140D7
MNQSQSVDASVARWPHFWVSHLLAGCCFAVGHGITHRVLILQNVTEPPPSQPFAPSGFPSDTRQALRPVYRGNNDALQIDLATVKEIVPGGDTVRQKVVSPQTGFALRMPTESDRIVPTWSDSAWNAKQDDISVESIQGQENQQNSAAIVFTPSANVVPAIDTSLLLTESESLVRKPKPVFVPSKLTQPPMLPMQP